LVNRNLGMLPLSWGLSWRGLNNLFNTTKYIETLSPVRRSGILIGKDTMSCGERYDEEFYLAEYPDVAAAVASGALFKSGWYHYSAIGRKEGRLGAPTFDEKFYLNSYPDVKEAVFNKIFPSGQSHYESAGREEGRIAAYNDYFLEYSLPQPCDGMSSDYLLLHLSLVDDKAPKKLSLEIRWKSEIPEQADSIRFLAAPGYMLIPMGNSPAWLLAKSIERVRISFSHSLPSSFMIRATLLSLK
jgi:hypothetical protein